MTDQSANAATKSLIAITADRAGVVSIADRTLIPANQPADTHITRYAAAHQPDIADGFGRRHYAKQAYRIRYGGPVDGQSVDGVAQAVKIPGEIACGIPHWGETGPGIPTTGGTGIYVATQRVIAGQSVFHALQGGACRIIRHA